MTYPAARLTTDEWVGIFRRLGGKVRDAVGPLLAAGDGGTEVGIVGAGGDRTLELDWRAEESVLAGLRELAGHGHRFSVLSEEAGAIDMGAEYPRVVVDPIDGSPNARRSIRMVGLMISLLTGPTVGDIAAGLTMDLTTGEEWTAARGAGALHDGRSFRPERRVNGAKIEVLGLHALPNDLARAWPLLRVVATFRQFYCMSLSLVYTAQGGLDIFCSSRQARIFDLTAGILTIKEVGGVVTDLDGGPIDHLPVGLETRTTLLCSAHPDLHDLAVASVSGGDAGPVTDLPT